MKPYFEISGRLEYPLEIGYRAFICKDDGKTIMTSQVLDIRNETDDSIEIETRNTIYKLKFAVRIKAA